MFFECEYCKSKFKSPINFKKHLCEKKKKFMLLNSKMGQVAFICYENWRNLKGFFAPTKETFLASKYFKSFINFVDFCAKNSLPEKNGFIKLMVLKNVQPSLWTNDVYYAYYIEHFDTIYTPMRQVEISLEYLYKISSILECPIQEVFKNMSMIDVLKLIAIKKISPWLLLFMKSFKHHIAFGITEEERDLLDTVLNAAEWQIKLKEDPKSVEKIKQLMTSLNI
jgi:hypothetical protein